MPVPPRVVICVFGCITLPQYCLQLLKLQETWGRRAEEVCDVPVYYFVGEEHIVGLDHPEVFRYPHRMIYLPGVANDYLSASYKQNLGLAYLHSHGLAGDFVFVCGTDTFINIDALVRFLTFFDPQERLYIGGHHDHFNNHQLQFDRHLLTMYPDAGLTPLPRDDIQFHLGGAGFVLSRGMVSALAPFLPTMTDVWITQCQQAHQEAYIPTCDVCLAIYIYCLGGKSVRYFHRFYECNFQGMVNLTKMYGYPRFYHCCNHRIQARDIISCHNMSLGDFDHFTNILDEHGWFRGPAEPALLETP